ncbi:hypothetical protein ACTFIV_004252 [Dictyostelium citrinum]
MKNMFILVAHIYNQQPKQLRFSIIFIIHDPKSINNRAQTLKPCKEAHFGQYLPTSTITSVSNHLGGVATIEGSSLSSTIASIITISDSYKSKLVSILDNGDNNNNKLFLNCEKINNSQVIVLKYLNEIESFNSFISQDELNDISITFSEQELSTTIGEFNSNDNRVNL